MTELQRQQILNDEHLRLLRLGYFIAAGMDVMFALFPLIYVAVGLFIALGGFPNDPAQPNAPNPAMLGSLFAIFGSAISLFFAVCTVLKFMAARALGQRRSRKLCLVAAGFSCLSLPWGTALGVFTFIVLGRPSVKEQFDSDGGTLPTRPETLDTSGFPYNEMHTRTNTEPAARVESDI